MKRDKRGSQKDVVNIREMLRLVEAGLNQTQIAQSCNVARSTVQDYQRRAQAAGVSFEAAREMPDDELLRLLRKGGNRGERKPCEIDYAAVAAELGGKKKKNGVTLALLWQEKVIGEGKDLSYAEFCRRFQVWNLKSHCVMRQTHIPGEKLFVDYCGLTIPYRDSETEKKAQVFVAAHGASSFTYAEATANQKIESWLGSHSRAFESFGGVPAVVVPDNLKSGVKDPWWYEPEINRSFQDFAEHYGIVVLPTRPAAPRDKSKVEKAVQEVERWVIAPLRHQIFYSIEEINRAMQPLLTALNARQMRDYEASRQELFEKIDLPALKPLPPRPYQIGRWKLARVNIDYHIEFDKHWYSVPYYHVRQEVWIKASEKLVEVFQNNRRIAYHQRSNVAYQHTTLPEHMPPEHAAVKSWTADKFIAWGKAVGVQTHQLVLHILASKAHPEQGFRAVLGLQRLSEKFTTARLESACHRANHFKLSTIRNIRFILEKGWDKLPLSQPVPEAIVREHTNLRGETMFH